MLGKIALLALAIFVVMIWWKHSVIQRVRKEMLMRDREHGTLRSRSKDGTMVRCATCDMFLPLDEAVSSRGAYYCSPEHAKAKSRQ